MNEKIEELYWKCNKVHGDYSNGGYYVLDVEKFAELIIEECIVLAKRERIRNGSDTEHNQAVSKVIESIKQHFGIE